MLSADPNTGAVTVVQDIDRESLSENDLRLIVSVQDEPKGQLISKCLDQSSNENIVRISALNFFIASMEAPGSFLGLPVGFLINDIT